jgi:hypothetical protein
MSGLVFSFCLFTRELLASGKCVSAISPGLFPSSLGEFPSTSVVRPSKDCRLVEPEDHQIRYLLPHGYLDDF